VGCLAGMEGTSASVGLGCAETWPVFLSKHRPPSFNQTRESANAEGHRRCIDQLLLRAFVISDERADVICSSARPVGGLWKQGSGEAPSFIGWMAGSGGGANKVCRAGSRDKAKAKAILDLSIPARPAKLKMGLHLQSAGLLKLACPVDRLVESRDGAFTPSPLHPFIPSSTPPGGRNASGFGLIAASCEAP
jgi:hypothetical protein